MANSKFGPESDVFFPCYHVRMRDVIILLVHLITTILRIARPGGLRSVIAEPLSHQTSASDRESLSPLRPQPPIPGSADRRTLFALDKTDSARAGSHCIKTVNPAAIRSLSGPAKVSDAVFARAPG